MLGKQAKVLSETQVQELLTYIAHHTKTPLRNTVMILLSYKAGLRAKEISALRWSMLIDSQGHLLDTMTLPNSASNGNSGRSIPLHPDLRLKLLALKYQEHVLPYDPVIRSTHKGPMTAPSIVNWFWQIYRHLGFDGCSSHSGRRTFITRAARKISEAGGSLRDVQQLAGHSNLATTQRYIDGDEVAKRKVVNLI